MFVYSVRKVKQSYSPVQTEKLNHNCRIMDVEQKATFSAIFLRHYKPLTL